jgi:glyoxylase-like metal-dependent hydrolase (beta-lactamase superfamily II)
MALTMSNGLRRDIADPVERIIEAPDGHVISLNGRELVCLDTPGHARHHICIVDHKAKAIFTGDMFGLSYRELDVDGRQFIFPTTTPTQFEPDEMRASIKRLVALQPQAMYLTHYSQFRSAGPGQNCCAIWMLWLPGAGRTGGR